MEKKKAVYICTGCDIGASLDVDALSSLATGDLKASLCKTHAYDLEGVLI